LNRTLATAISRMAELESGRGRFRAARDLFREAVQLGDRVGNEVWHNDRTLAQVATLYQLGVIEYFLGDFAAARTS
ncbi:MAG TPA: tetratricopeptide repeat protein, partial [Pirellulaceae bacterium]